MNSTATELELTRRRAMRGIVNVFVVWTLGLAVLFGSPAVSLAQPKIQRFTECKGTCWYAGARGYELGVFTFRPEKPNDTSCTFVAVDIYVPCKDNAGVVHPGTSFGDCKLIPGMVPRIGLVKPPVAK